MIFKKMILEGASSSIEPFEIPRMAHGHPWNKLVHNKKFICAISCQINLTSNISFCPLKEGLKIKCKSVVFPPIPPSASPMYGHDILSSNNIYFYVLGYYEVIM